MLTLDQVADKECTIGVPAGWTEDTAKKAKYDAYYEVVSVAGYTLAGACLMAYSSPAGDAYIFVTNTDSPLPLTADRVVDGSPPEMLAERFPGYVAVGEAEYPDKMTAIVTATVDDGNMTQMLHVNAAPPQVWNINIIYEEGALDQSTIDDIIASFEVI
jgi:hypothetical protein